MSTIAFSPEERVQMTERLQQFLSSELAVELGRFDAEHLLDFFVRDIGAFVYNRALLDAHALLTKRFEDLTEAVYELEKPVV